VIKDVAAALNAYVRVLTKGVRGESTAVLVFCSVVQCDPTGIAARAVDQDNAVICDRQFAVDALHGRVLTITS
jgi:hypothetical protein